MTKEEYDNLHKAQYLGKISETHNTVMRGLNPALESFRTSAIIAKSVMGDSAKTHPLKITAHLLVA